MPRYTHRQNGTMDLSHFYELIGYTGSLLVAISLSMKSLQRLRIVNMAGALFFILYGILIGPCRSSCSTA
jgi:uncharacterized membrane protein YqgA involved in biofilm formation